MKSELEQQDIEAIAERVIERIKPLLSCKCERHDQEEFDVQGLASYLGVSVIWIYHNQQRLSVNKSTGKLRFKKKDIDRWKSEGNVPPIR